MPFDGVNWAQGGLIPAITYQPNAGCSADMWFTACVTAYAKARKSARLVATYAFGWNGVGGWAGAVPASKISDVTIQPTGEYDIWVETTWTHIVALVFFGVVSERVAYAYHRFRDYDGTTVETSNYRTEIAVSKSNQDEEQDNPKFANIVRMPTEIQFVAMEQDITGQVRNVDHVVYIEALASTTYDILPPALPFAAGTEATYIPVYHAIFLECRG